MKGNSCYWGEIRVEGYGWVVILVFVRYSLNWSGGGELGVGNIDCIFKFVWLVIGSVGVLLGYLRFLNGWYDL